MYWQSLISMNNLRLAWCRIKTGDNPQHKYFFREVYLVYETALDQNLKYLSQRLRHGDWVPSHPQRLYIPKSTGLQRPLTLLSIEDQILLQAVANIFAQKLARKRKKVELKSVFSNILGQANSIFFIRPWRETYSAFQKRCKALYDMGNRCVAQFDLSAYYDTISHELLLQIVSPRGRHGKAFTEISKWLRQWSSSIISTKTSHGIPQGPIASNFLSEIFFLPIDIELNKAGIKYVRYVDDIRIFGATENEVRKAAIFLERLCRERGLIPQGKKFAILHANSHRDALGNLPSIPPAKIGEDVEQMSVSRAISLLNVCVEGRPFKITDKSRFRYVMHRAPKSHKILDKIMHLFPRYPEYIDAFIVYFSNYGSSKRIANGIIDILRKDFPYLYVRGELWHLLARLGTQQQLLTVLEIARRDARERRRCFGLSWGVMNFLIKCQEEGLCRIGTRLRTEIPLSRSLLASRIPATEFAPERVVTLMLKGTIEEQLAAARQLKIRNCSLSQIGLSLCDLPEVCQNSLRSLGVIPSISRTQKDWIAERIQRSFGGRTITIWRKLLGDEYEHSLQILIEADATYSDWLQYQDSFNNVVVRQFIGYLNSRGLPGGTQRIIEANGRLVKYGVLLDPARPFAATFPIVSGKLLNAHRRRNKLPGSHPYDEKGGSKNRWLSRGERSTLRKDVGSALQEIALYVSTHP
jgi:retron-type reverse transcriptase